MGKAKASIIGEVLEVRLVLTSYEIGLVYLQHIGKNGVAVNAGGCLQYMCIIK